MDGMGAAIRGRRGGLIDQGIVDQEPKVATSPGYGDAKELKGLVMSLDDSQKSMLLKMLVKDQGANANAPPDLEEGAAGPGEQSEVEEFVSQMEPEEGHESEDDIAESMISSADKMRAESGTKPRNLGERMKIGLAQKLKKKG